MIQPAIRKLVDRTDVSATRVTAILSREDGEGSRPEIVASEARR